MCHRKGGEYSLNSRKGEGAKTDLLCESNPSRSRNEISEDRKSSIGGGDYNKKVKVLFSKFSSNCKKNLPIRQVLQKMDLAGRMLKWAIELSEYDLIFEGRGLVRPQALVDFVAEMAISGKKGVWGSLEGWILSVDGLSNVQGSGAGIILEGPDGVLVEQSLKLVVRIMRNMKLC